MPFYDNVKRRIRGGDDDSAETEEDDVGFDELKRDVDDEEDEEPAGDGTEIEVLQDGELRSESDSGSADGFPERSGSGRPGQDAQDTAANAASAADAEQPEGRPDARQRSPDAATPDAAANPQFVELLEQVTDQNQEIIGLLRGIKRGLER